MNRFDIAPQQKRENEEPEEQTNPIPWFVIFLTVSLLSFGVYYIATSGIVNPPTLGDGRSISELQGSAPLAGSGVDGAAIYASRCAACHQANGAGLPGVFPPLAGSEWVLGKDTTLAAILLHGINGALTVKGNTYNGVMPNFDAQLNDAEVAAVLSHIRNQWGNNAPAIAESTVAQVRKETLSRSAPFKGDEELNALK